MEKQIQQNQTSDFYKTAMLDAMDEESTEASILSYITSISKIDEQVKKRLENKFKSPSKCWSYIQKQAEKFLNRTSGHIPMQKIFGWAVHYYSEDDDFLSAEGTDLQEYQNEPSAITVSTAADRLAAIKAKLVK